MLLDVILLILETDFLTFPVVTRIIFYLFDDGYEYVYHFGCFENHPMHQAKIKLKEKAGTQNTRMQA